MEANLQIKFTTLIFFAAISSLMISPSLQSTTSIKYCDRKASYAVKVEGIDMIPFPVVSGQPATFKISASSGQPISGGKMSLQVLFLGITVHSESHNICEKSSCPISAGKFVLSHTQVLPGITPPGTYTLKMRMTDESNKQLTCISFNFKISSGSYDSAL
ncbi:ML domain-containing protein [Heracleum sosnowskyi]|uniref:ML domain-containing protein n=1 Tax=Heracleum sosnowskyi TaxID=360622 RepID=A0AAD8GUZ5_9APIA|nr:ML domain-containing protein [Heracleum sosnowskyi]